jgi:acetyltransferase EpsM
LNAVLGGGVAIGERSHIGIGAKVLQGIRIGKRVTVGAGAVVINNVKDGETVVGIPAKNIK